MGEFLKDGSVASSLCPFSYQGKVIISRTNECAVAFFIDQAHSSVHESFTTRPNVSTDVFTVFTILCSASLSRAIKVTVFGKPLLVYLETLRQVVKKDHAQGQIPECSNTCTLFRCQNLFPSSYLFCSRHGFTGNACTINRRLLLLYFIHTRH